MSTIPAPLKGKIAIVTGGTRGIGAAIVRKFAEHGASHIAISYVSSQEKAEKSLDSVREIDPAIKTTAVHADVADPDFGPKVVNGALAGLGVDRIDIVVSNAAYIDLLSMPPFGKITKQQWDNIITGTAWCSLSLAQASIDYMHSGGRIIMISSGSSKFPQGDPAIAYCAGKAAVDAISRNLGAILGASKGVTCNTISVGATDTDAFRDGAKGMGPEFEKFAADFSLLKRVGKPEEVASIVAFVASPEASWIVGNQIPANGGGLSMLQS